jgi:hypothetical protein
MRKWLAFLFLSVALLLPVTAHAQQGISIARLNVQLWPEYDRPSMLAIYDFSLAEGSALPAQVTIRIPENADLNAVAHQEEGSLVNVPYDTPVQEDGWLVIRFTVTDFSVYRVEYYAPLQKDGDSRSYLFEWAGDYPVEVMAIQVQQPLTGDSLETSPALPDQTEDEAHLIYHEGTFSSVPAGKRFTLSITYHKKDDLLSVSTMPIQPINEPQNHQPFSIEKTLPWVLGIVGILLILGGVVYYFFSGKTRTRKPTSRPRHTPRPEKTDDADAQAIYCHQCGARAQPGDKFCRVCGTRLRNE